MNVHMLGNVYMVNVNVHQDILATIVQKSFVLIIAMVEEIV